MWSSPKNDNLHHPSPSTMQGHRYIAYQDYTNPFLPQQSTPQPSSTFVNPQDLTEGNATIPDVDDEINPDHVITEEEMIM